MQKRRTFLKRLATGSGSALLLPQTLPAASTHPKPDDSGVAQRKYWLSVLQKIATPVLESLSHRELRKSMPVETAGSAEKLKKYTHLEAISRLLVGMAPWLEAEGLADDEKSLQQ